MRISDWSSDVCSSDLPAEAAPTRASWRRAHRARRRPRPALERAPELARIAKADAGADLGDRQVAAAHQLARSLAAHLVVQDAEAAAGGAQLSAQGAFCTVTLRGDITKRPALVHTRAQTLHHRDHDLAA